MEKRIAELIRKRFLKPSIVFVFFLYLFFLYSHIVFAETIVTTTPTVIIKSLDETSIISLIDQGIQKDGNEWSTRIGITNNLKELWLEVKSIGQGTKSIDCVSSSFQEAIFGSPSLFSSRLLPPRDKIIYTVKFHQKVETPFDVYASFGKVSLTINILKILSKMPIKMHIGGKEVSFDILDDPVALIEMYSIGRNIKAIDDAASALLVARNIKDAAEKLSSLLNDEKQIRLLKDLLKKVLKPKSFEWRPLDEALDKVLEDSIRNFLTVKNIFELLKNLGEQIAFAIQIRGGSKDISMNFALKPSSTLLSSLIINAYRNSGGISVFGDPLPQNYTISSGVASTGTSYKAVELSRGGIYEYSRGVFVVYGAIYKKYKDIGKANHYLGLPTSNEGDAPKSPQGTTGRFSRFERGTINWLRDKNQTFLVQGAIYEKWTSLGYSGGQLGFPTSDEYPYQGGARSDFEGGSITWTSQKGTQVAFKPQQQFAEQDKQKNELKRELEKWEKIINQTQFEDVSKRSSLIVRTWRVITDKATGVQLNEEYKKLYGSAKSYLDSARSSLNKAQNQFERGELDQTKYYLIEAQKVYKMSLDTNQMAIQVWDGLLAAGEILAKGLQQASDVALAGLGALVPGAPSIVDKFFLTRDFVADSVMDGIGEASKKAIVKIGVSKVFSEFVPSGRPIKGLGDIDLSTLARRLKEDPNFRVRVENEIIKALSQQIVEDKARQISRRFIDEFAKFLAVTPPPPPTSQLSSGVIDAYNRSGGSSVFGDPLPQNYTTPSGVASTGTFYKAVELSRGGIYESSKGVFVVYGAIYQKYRAVGGPRHYLGLPTSNEGDAPRSPQGTTGRFSRFERGGINWLREKNQTFIVQGAIFDKWASLGYSGGKLGFPTSDEYPYQVGARGDFEGGYITWTAQTGVQVVYKETQPANPQIASISLTQVQAGKFTLTINGSNFDSGAVDQFYTPSGQPMGSGVLSGDLISRSTNQIVVRENLTGAPAGSYSIRVKNSDGKMSGPVNISVTAAAPPPPPPPPPPLTCTDGVQFVVDVTVSDGSQMQAGQNFTKTWRLKNTGSCSWGSGYSLVFVSGSQMGASSSASVPSVSPNATGEVSVSMVAPTTPGVHQGYWQMRNAKGQAFGSQIWVKINVVSVAPPPPTPQVLARIDDYSPKDPNNPVRVQVGGSTSLSVRFTNTGNTAWRFIVGASVWDSKGRVVGDYSTTLSAPLQLGQQTSVSWSHLVREAGDYWVQFGVWKAAPFVGENLLEKRPTPAQRLINARPK
jgi:hypothetical protein